MEPASSEENSKVGVGSGVVESLAGPSSIVVSGSVSSTFVTVTVIDWLAEPPLPSLAWTVRL